MMPISEVIIETVRDHRYQHRPMSSVKGIMLHRVGVDLVTGIVIGYEAVEICDAFCGRQPRWHRVAAVTGGQNPYTFYVGGDRGHLDLHGKLWQALELTEIGHHGRSASRSHIGIGLIGDFRVQPPGAKQWGAAVSLCADLCLTYDVPSKRVVGHGEVPSAHGGEKAPGRGAACPGHLLPMDVFRQQVAQVRLKRVRKDAFWRLEDHGFKLP